MLPGILMNVLGGELLTSPGLPAFTVTLANILDEDCATLLDNYAAKKPQQVSLKPLPVFDEDGWLPEASLVQCAIESAEWLFLCERTNIFYL